MFERFFKTDSTCRFPKGFPQGFLKRNPPPLGRSPWVLFYSVMFEEGDPFLRGAVARDGRGRPTMPFDEDVVEVAGLRGREFPKPEIVHDEVIPGEPAAE